MNRQTCRQVLECGDGVCEVTALAVAALKIAVRGADSVTPTQSGDSEDSVAAVQDARAPTGAALGSRLRCPVSSRSRLPRFQSQVLQSCLWLVRRSSDAKSLSGNQSEMIGRAETAVTLVEALANFWHPVPTYFLLAHDSQW